jgi:WD40 repeat protein
MEDSAGVIARPIAGLAAPPSVAALSGDVAAIPDHRGAGDVVVYGPGGACARLTGFHRARVTALCFFEDELLLRLYTVATDGLAAWAIQRGGAGPMQGPGMSVEGPETVVEESLDEVPEHLGVDAAGRRLVVCAGRVTRVVSLKSGKVLARLEGHGGNVVAAAFRGGDAKDVVVSIGEDRRFIVYDLKAGAILYSSSIVSSSPFTSLAIEHDGNRCAIGSVDGVVLDLNPNPR